MKPAFNTVPLPGLALLCIVFMSFACTSVKETAYFYGVPSGPIPSNMTVPESIIQKNDILSIVVSDLNPKATEIFNPGNTDNNDPSATQNKDMSRGYLVDSDGNIYFPLLGSIKSRRFDKEPVER
jgi:polysaccharide export outer membrane protein